MTTLWLSRRPPNTVRPDAKELRQERAKPLVNRRPDVQEKQGRLRLKALLADLVLLPMCLFAMVASYELFLHPQVQTSLWASPEFQWFIVGVWLWLVTFAFIRRTFSIVYVFGHEWTHIFATRLCRGTVYDYAIRAEGGWVDTNKSNTFISLSPYMIPFYSVIAVLCFAAVGVFTNLEAPLYLADLPGLRDFTLMKGLYFTVGLTWCFHFCYTLRTLRHRQSDVLRNGVKFSRLLIFLVNLGLIGFILVLASPTITMKSAVASVANTAERLAAKYGTAMVTTGQALSREARGMRDDLQAWRQR